jgi:Ser/Thr protein kinase RdoA (MazF antagonist)
MGRTRVHFRQGVIKVGSLTVVYSTPSAAAVADLVSTHYDLPDAMACRLLRRGWNDSFEIKMKDGERCILRISKRRWRGDADVASETAFLAYLDRQGVPVAAAIPLRDGSLFSSAAFPEGRRSIVLFRFAEGRPSEPTAADARANGVTLARMHEAAGGFLVGDKTRYRLDGDHLLHRPVSAISADQDISDSVRAGFVDLAGRLSGALASCGGLTWTHCHGDCHGYNANIVLQGPRAGQAVFFDFDESGPGYLAYDLAVFLWNCVSFGRNNYRLWHAFIEGYRSIRELSEADLAAVHLFVPIRHAWLIGEYASRIYEWGRQAVPAEWFGEQLNFMLAWEKEKLGRGLF